ncbi:hypothetical protein [Bradyrhizobium sp.]|uniref:hypothetical protein n=1 Tax=Bradyrhizobium sp. TaxID=376 RepID=UPI00260A2E9B|nr:hypothetical protein [Bradyrhizobium sp.]
MAIIDLASLSPPADRHDGHSLVLAGIRAFFSAFFAKAFDPYRPELHYMRGPGPACRAKQTIKSQRAG